MFGLLRFPLISSFMKSKRAHFPWTYLITLSNRFYKNFLPKRSYSPGKRQNWILLFYQSGRTSTHVENVISIWSRGSVAHCFNLLHIVRYRMPSRWQRFESSCNQSVFNFFSIGSACSRSLFSFANMLYFMWLTLFDLILLWNSSNIFAQLFILKIKQK